MIRSLCLASAALLAAAADDFAGCTPELFKAAERGATVAVAKQADGSQALALRFDEVHGEFHEVYLKPGRALAGDGVLVARVRVAGRTPVWSLSLRVRDAKGEMFDFNAPLPAADDEGWRDVRFAVRQDAVKAHWGGNPGSGRLEAPLTLAGLACNVGGAGAGELVVASLAADAAKP